MGESEVAVVEQSGKTMGRFPIDCPYDCEHHKQWDMSVDDYTHYCDLLHMQIDEYDCGFTGLLPLCPMRKGADE